MQAVLGAALPIFGLILTGWLAARTGLLGRRATDSLNLFAFYLALPALLFGSMSRITPEQFAQGGFAVAFAGGIALAFAAGLALARLRGCRLAEAAIQGMDASYGNVGFMGIPLCFIVFGEAGVPPAVISTLFTAGLLFAATIVLIESDFQRDRSSGAAVRNVLRSLARNPLLLAPLLGIAVAVSGWPLPGPLERYVTVLAGAASPCALVCIGLFLAQERLAGELGTVAVLVGLKLVLQPAATALMVFYVFDMPPVWSKAAVLLSALPTGSGPFTLAKLHGLDAGVTSGAILVSHLLSVVTVSLLIAWLG